MCGLEPPQLGSEPPQLERESVSNPRGNRKFKDFGGTLSSFNRFSPSTSFAKLRPWSALGSREDSQASDSHSVAAGTTPQISPAALELLPRIGPDWPIIVLSGMRKSTDICSSVG